MAAQDALKATGLFSKLENLGYKKRSGLIFTKEISDEAIGWLGLNTASKYQRVGEVEVNPVIGIRHQAVEREVADLCGEKFHPYLPPTVSSPLGHLMPESRYKGWFVDSIDSHESMGDLVSSIGTFGLKFYEAGRNLPEICRLIDRGIGIGPQLEYRRPVAWLMAGDVVTALRLADEAEAGIVDRADAAAVRLRAFISALRGRALAAESQN